ncbi:MAG: hypothetical protein JXR37_09020 [Kiritimatiellae bacterium]|nr:hypothetical protein [Kiritimatiellia bacterium]
MKSWRRRLAGACIEIAAVIVLHGVLMHLMARHDVVSRLFAAGGHVPPLTLVLACFFMMIRLFTVICLPGMILYRLAPIAYDQLVARRSQWLQRPPRPRVEGEQD